MTVPPTRLAVIESDVDVGLPPEDRIALGAEVHRSRSAIRGWGQAGQGEEQRSPAKVFARQRAGRGVSLGVRGRPRAAGLPPGMTGFVAPGERASQHRVTASRVAQLRELGEPPLPQRHRVLGVLARRHGEIRERRRERNGKGAMVPREQVRENHDPALLGDRHGVPQTA